MKDYTETDSVFNETIEIPETTDTNHADNINHAPLEIYANTMVLRNALLPGTYVDGETYGAGDYVLKDGKIYKVLEELTEWDETKVEEVNLFAMFASLTDSLNIPAQVSPLTYDGTSQSPTWTNYDSNKMIMGGVTSAVDAGTYVATFTPKDSYHWTDGSTATLSIEWTIGKAVPVLTLSQDSVALDSSTLESTITVSYDGDGKMSVASSDEQVATAALTDNEIAIRARGAGAAEVVVSVEEGSNYFGTSVSCQVISSFGGLNELSWERISEISAAGTAANYFAVGDMKLIHLEGTVGTLELDHDYYVYILGFDHNAELEGKGITFGGFKLNDDSLMYDLCLVDGNYSSTSYDGSKWFNLNHWGTSSTPYNTNYGGWRGCDARYDILGSTDSKPSGYGSTPTTSRTGYDASDTCATSPVTGTLMAALPEDLREQMKPMTIYTDGVGNSSDLEENVVGSVDYLPLLAEYEIFGTRSYANEFEQVMQKQYEYYAEGNSKVKYRQSAISTTAIWWERSAYAGSTGTFCNVSTSGAASSSNYNSRISYGIAPAFRI